MSYRSAERQFSILAGQVLAEVRGMEAESEEVIFELEDGRIFKMYHMQDCCETVRLWDVVGEVRDILNTPILSAREESNTRAPKDFTPSKWDDSQTWTFYRITTIKGSVVLRWLGASNGYYSESVDFVEIPT